MKILPSWLHRGADKQPPELKNAIIANTVGQSIAKRDEDIIFKQMEATNYELLHDEAIEQMFDQLMWKPAVILDPAQPTGYRVVPKAELDFNIASLRIIISHINRASFISKEEAAILKIKLRHVLRRIKMEMRPDVYNMGVANFLKSVEIQVNIMLADAIDGRKAKLLKTVPRIEEHRIVTGEMPKQKESVVM